MSLHSALPCNRYLTSIPHMHFVLVPSFYAAIRGISVTYSMLDVITQHVTKDMPMRSTARVVVQTALSLSDIAR